MNTKVPYFFGWLLISSCHGGSGKPSDSPVLVRPAPIPSPDSLVSVPKHFVERTRLQRNGFTIIGLAFYSSGPDSTGDENANDFVGYSLVVENHASHSIDTLTVDSSSDASADFLKVRDITDSVPFAPLLIEVTTSGSSDFETSSFCGYKTGHLGVLFTVQGYDEATLKRKDEHLLVGKTSLRDDLVACFEDYPFEVDLADYSVSFPTPEKLYIGMNSKVLESFKDVKGHLLKKGTDIVIDTLYNSTRMVRIIIPNKDTVLAREDDAMGKVQGNSAG